MRKGMIRAICAVMVCLVAFAMMPLSASAASYGTYSKSFSVVNCKIPGGKKVVDCKDNFTVKYDKKTKKLKSVDAYQTIKSFMGITTFKKGGIELISKSKDGKTMVYESKWTRSTPRIEIKGLKLWLRLGDGTYRYTVTAKGVTQKKVKSCSVICER